MQGGLEKVAISDQYLAIARKRLKIHVYNVHATMRLTSIEFSFDPCNIYRDGPRSVGYPADARSVGDSHPSCYLLKLHRLMHQEVGRK